MNDFKRRRLGIVSALLSLVLLTPFVPAREIGSVPSTPDAWSVAGGNCYVGGFVTGCEVAVDFNGNFVPTLTNAQTLGSSSLVWSNIYSTALTITGATTFAGQTVFGTAPNVSTITSAGVIQAASITDAGTLSVTGASTLTGNVNSKGQTTLGTLPNVSTFTSAGAAQLVSLGVTGVSTLTGEVDAAGVITAGGASAVGGTLVVKSTSSVAENNVLNLQDNNGVPMFQVHVDSRVIVSGEFDFASRTLAQLQALAPEKVGGSFYCADCVPPKVVIATGTAAGNWADAVGGQFK